MYNACKHNSNLSAFKQCIKLRCHKTITLLVHRWKSIDKNDFATVSVNHTWLQELRDQVVLNLREQLTTRTSFIRGDYREVAELALVLLGAGSPQPRFHNPGAYHHARWMAKVRFNNFPSRSQERLNGLKVD